MKHWIDFVFVLYCYVVKLLLPNIINVKNSILRYESHLLEPVIIYSLLLTVAISFDGSIRVQNWPSRPHYLLRDIFQQKFFTALVEDHGPLIKIYSIFSTGENTYMHNEYLPSYIANTMDVHLHEKQSSVTRSYYHSQTVVSFGHLEHFISVPKLMVLIQFIRIYCSISDRIQTQWIHNIWF